MFNLTVVVLATAGARILLLEPGGSWYDSQVLVAVFTVTIPLLMGQYWAARKNRQEVVSAAKIVKQEVHDAAEVQDEKLANIGAVADETLGHVNGQKTQLEQINARQRLQMKAAGIEPDEEPRA